MRDVGNLDQLLLSLGKGAIKVRYDLLLLQGPFFHQRKKELHNLWKEEHSLSCAMEKYSSSLNKISKTQQVDDRSNIQHPDLLQLSRVAHQAVRDEGTNLARPPEGDNQDQLTHGIFARCCSSHNAGPGCCSVLTHSGCHPW